MADDIEHTTNVILLGPKLRKRQGPIWTEISDEALEGHRLLHRWLRFEFKMPRLTIPSLPLEHFRRKVRELEIAVEAILMAEGLGFEDDIYDKLTELNDSDEKFLAKVGVRFGEIESRWTRAIRDLFSL